MRIGFDCGALGGAPTGVGRYVRELRGALTGLGVGLEGYAVSARPAGDDSVARWRVPARVAQASWRRFGAPAIELLIGPVDVVHGTNFVLPALRRAAGVVTVHDLSFYRDDTFPGGRRLRDLVPWSVRRAARVIVPTHAVAREVGERLGVPEEQIAVTYEGVSERFLDAAAARRAELGAMGIQGPLILAVGTIEPRKNLPRLLEAWRSTRTELPGWTLAIAGPRGWGPDLAETPGVVLLGWVGDDRLPGLLAAADLFCYPSLYEGFGLPPLEAMAAGTAAVVGRSAATEEVLGDAAMLVDPLDPDAIGDALLRLATDDASRQRYMAAGRAHAAGFTWRATAEATLAAYEAALAP